MKAEFITWLLFFFMGFAGGVLVGVWVDKDIILKVGKIKNKRIAGDVDTVIPVDIEKPKKRAKNERDGLFKRIKIKRQKKRLEKLMEKM